MKPKTKKINWLLALTLLFPITACIDGPNIAEGGIGGTGIGSGSISGFGSIFVNGIKYDVNSADIFIEGSLASESELDLGMVVSIQGSFDPDSLEGKATQIDYQPNIIGNVDSVNIATKFIIVEGQTVTVDALTVFHGTDLVSLTAGTRVTVSGLPNRSGNLVARYVAVRSNFQASEIGDPNNGVSSASEPTFDPTDSANFSTSSITIEGKVSALDPFSTSFLLGARQVDYSQASVAPDVLANGVKVRVSGDATQTTMAARKISLASPLLSGQDGTVYALDGYVQNTPNNNILINGNEVLLTAATKVTNGRISTLRQDDHIQVIGRFNSDNSLIAESVTFLNSASVRIEAEIELIDRNRITLAGIPTTVSSRTIMLDSSAERIRRFSTGDLRIGEKLIVHGTSDNNIEVVLSRLERKDTLQNTILEGPVNTITVETSFDILGTTIDTTNISIYQDRDGQDISSSEFFNTLLEGDVIQVIGSRNGSIFQASEVKAM